MLRGQMFAVIYKQRKHFASDFADQTGIKLEVSVSKSPVAPLIKYQLRVFITWVINIPAMLHETQTNFFWKDIVVLRLVI